MRTTTPRPRRHALLLAGLLGLAACSSDGPDADTTATSGSPATSTSAVVAGDPFPDARCAANQEAGEITFLTGFDYAAAASIVDVIVAEEAGYYDELCLDVTIRPSFSAANYALVAEGNAQFASGGSFSEVVNFAAANDADFRAISVEGRSAIDTLIVKPGRATTLDDLAGETIGVKGKLPASIEAMLLSAGLVEGEDFQTVPLDGFDPIAHIEIDPIVGLPGWKSNEVGQLERAGYGFEQFDPLDFGVPGSFGVIFTSGDVVEQHPTVVEDFTRATMRGLADAIADPTSAAETAVELITANGNPNFLSPEGEIFRWQTEAELIIMGTPEGIGFASPITETLQAELDAYAAVGLFGEGETPSAADHLVDGLMASVYDAEAQVIWPGAS